MDTYSDLVRINLFGMGCSITKGEFDEPTWNRLNECSWKLKSTLDTAIFHPSFFSTLKSAQHKSTKDLGTVFQISGLLFDQQSEIEIRVNKKKKKISFRELFNENLIFPLYITERIKMSDSSASESKKLEIVEKETGMVGTFKFSCDNFSLDKLSFTIADVSISSGEKFTVLTKLNYDGKILQSTRPDTLVRGQFALLS